MDFSWRSFAFYFHLPLVLICVELLHDMFMICVLHELGLWFVVGFEHLVCNLWWTMLIYVTLIYLCSSCGCEVVLSKIKFIYIYIYIYCILYVSIFTCRGNSIKIFKISVYLLLDFISKLYAYIKGEFSLLIEPWWIYSYHILKFSRKMSKFLQSSISSLPYALCIKLTWTLLSLQNLVLSSITKKWEIESI